MLAKIDQLDLITYTPDGVQLSIVAELGEWARPERLWWLQEKVNGYAVYALDGQLAKDYPDLAGRPVTITIWGLEPPPQDVLDFIPRLQAQVNPQGVELIYRAKYKAAA